MPSLVEIVPVVQEKRYLKFVNVFSPFSNYLHLEKGVPLHFLKRKSPSPKETLCQVWLKLSYWFWRKRFLKFVNVFLLCHKYSPLGKGGPFICSKLNLLHPRMFCAKFGWIWPSGSEEELKMKMWKVYWKTDGQTDDGQQTIRKAHLSFPLLWAKGVE